MFIVFTAWWRRHSKDDKVRDIVDPIKLKLPVFGGLFTKIALTRFSRNLGTLLSSGVPILAALDIVSTTTGSKVIEKALHDVRQSSGRTGESIAEPLTRHTRSSRRWWCR